jgi:hypothetical protein
VKAPGKDGRFAERIVEGLDDAGQSERVVLWIERRPGALWAVGRQVNPQHRETEEPRADDYLWEGYELEDCLEAANAALEDDAVVSEDDGSDTHVKPFRREELLEPLEKFFFGRS